MKIWWLDIRPRERMPIRLMKFYYEDLRAVIIKVRGNKRIRARYLFGRYCGSKALTDKIEPERLEEMIKRCQGYFEID
jgi:hypothetical protein